MLAVGAVIAIVVSIVIGMPRATFRMPGGAIIVRGKALGEGIGFAVHLVVLGRRALRPLVRCPRLTSPSAATTPSAAAPFTPAVFVFTPRFLGRIAFAGDPLVVDKIILRFHVGAKFEIGCRGIVDRWFGRALTAAPAAASTTPTASWPTFVPLLALAVLGLGALGGFVDFADIVQIKDVEMAFLNFLDEGEMVVGGSRLFAGFEVALFAFGRRPLGAMTFAPVSVPGPLGALMPSLFPAALLIAALPATPAALAPTAAVGPFAVVPPFAARRSLRRRWFLRTRLDGRTLFSRRGGRNNRSRRLGHR